MKDVDHEHSLPALQLPPLATDLNDNVIINSSNSNNSTMLTLQPAAANGNENEDDTSNDSNDDTFSLSLVAANENENEDNSYNYSNDGTFVVDIESP